MEEQSILCPSCDVVVPAHDWLEHIYGTAHGRCRGFEVPGDQTEPMRPDSEPCCARAVPRRCTCRASYECPIHGGSCYGSHE